MKVFDRYEVLSELAVGGMGSILLARQATAVGVDRLVALKRLRLDVEHPDLAKLFLEEARVSFVLNHPNVVSVFDAGEWEGALYLVMEYIEGVSVSALVRACAKAKTPLSPLAVALVLRDAARGLHHAHTAADGRGVPLRMVHRDVSPQNVMVRLDGHAKVVDFGIAHAVNRGVRTEQGVIRGKLRYLSPEQLRAEPLDARTDQFALGVMAWELCARRSLYKPEEGQAMLEVLSVRAPPLSAVGASVPAVFESAVARLLEKDRAARFASCDELAVTLDAVVAQLGSEESARAELVGQVERWFGADLLARRKVASTVVSAYVPAEAPARVVCPRCSLSNSTGARFCNQCGAPLDGSAPTQAPVAAATERIEAARRPMVVLGVRWRSGDEEWTAGLLDALVAQVEAEGGRVVSQSGISLLATFGPEDIENAVQQAARCALASVSGALGLEGACRAAIEAGPVTLSERGGALRVLGAPVERVEALMTPAQSGEVVLGPSAYALAASELSTVESPRGRLLRAASSGAARELGVFIGRADELSALRAATRAVIQGGAGVGKSALLRQCAVGFSRSVRLELRSWAPGAPVGRTLWQALRATGLASALEPRDEAACWSAVAEESARLQVRWLFDDLDAVSLDTTKALVSRVELAGLSAVFTATSLPAFDHGLEVVPLAGLERAELGKLGAALVGRPLSAEVLTALLDATGGAPGGALELLRALRGDGLLEQRGGQWAFAAAPTSENLRLASLVERRLTSLSKPGQLVARAIALLGPHAQHVWLSAYTGPGAVVLAELDAAALVRTSADAVSFRDRSVADVVLSRMLPRDRELLSRELLETVESTPSVPTSAAGPAMVRLATQLDARTLVRVAQYVSERYASQGQLELAIDALAVAQRAAVNEPLHFAELSVRRARTLSFVRRDEALEEVQVGVAVIDAAAYPVHVARLRISGAHELAQRGAAEEARALLDPARRDVAASGDVELNAALLGADAAMALHAGDAREATVKLQAAFAMMNGREATDPDFYWVHLNLLGRAAFAVGRESEAVAFFTSAQQQASRVGRALGAGRALLNQASAALAKGLSSRAAGLLDEAEAAARAGGDIDALGKIAYSRGKLLSDQRAFTEAAESFRASLRWARTCGWQEGVALANMELEALARHAQPSGPAR